MIGGIVLFAPAAASFLTILTLSLAELNPWPRHRAEPTMIEQVRQEMAERAAIRQARAEVLARACLRAQMAARAQFRQNLIAK